MSIYARIQELATEHALSIRGLEEKIGFGNGTLKRWETNTPSVDRVERVADFFDVSTDFLLGRTDVPSTFKGQKEPVSYFRMDTDGLTDLEIDLLEEEMQEYQQFVKQRLEKLRKGMK